MSAEHVRILKRARTLIRRKEYQFVCCAVEEASRHTKARAEILGYISGAIAPYNSVIWWLYEAGGVCNYPSGNECVEYRLLWIDHMITVMEDWP